MEYSNLNNTKKIIMKKPSQKVAKKVPFSKLSKPQQRVEIAKDVLMQLGARKYIPENGVYVQPNIIEKTMSGLWNSEIDKLINENKITCNVCAKGALFMSHVMKTDNCTYGEAHGVGDGSICGRLYMFSKSQLDKIETAFEGWVEEGSKSRIAEFIKKYPKYNKRMVAIMKNIIKNNGMFKP